MSCYVAASLTATVRRRHMPAEQTRQGRGPGAKRKRSPIARRCTRLGIELRPRRESLRIDRDSPHLPHRGARFRSSPVSMHRGFWFNRCNQTVACSSQRESLTRGRRALFDVL